jgi:hypothetical protein
MRSASPRRSASTRAAGSGTGRKITRSKSRGPPVVGVGLQNALVPLGPGHETERPSADRMPVEASEPHSIDVRPRDHVTPSGEATRDEHVRSLGVDDEGSSVWGFSPLDRRMQLQQAGCLHRRVERSIDTVLGVDGGEPRAVMPAHIRPQREVPRRGSCALPGADREPRGAEVSVGGPHGAEHQHARWRPARGGRGLRGRIARWARRRAPGPASRRPCGWRS